MSWHYLQEQEEASWEGICLDGAPSALLSLLPTQGAYSSPDNATECCHASRSGMTCEHSMESRGEAGLMSSAVDSLAPTFQAQEKGLELKGKNLDSGKKWRGSFVKYSQDSHLWRIAQCSLVGDSEPYSETWPRWGLMQDGECWGLADTERLMTEREYGCWVGTPTCQNMKGTTPSLKFSEGRLPTPACLAKLNGGKPNPEWGEWLMGWVIGWTELQPLAMDRFRKWQQQHGGF